MHSSRPGKIHAAHRPLVVVDCTLLMRMSGMLPASNMRELADRIVKCGENTLHHHLSETLLRPTFDDPDYRNDFAVWAKQDLGDRTLAERLGIIDPYSFDSMDELREELVEIIESRLAELSPWVPSVRPGHEFYFTEATIVTFDTGAVIESPKLLADGIAGMSDGSIYFHFLEALRRPPLHCDDFTAWLGECPGNLSKLTAAIAGIDIYFRSLRSIRDELVAVLKRAGSG